MPKGSSSPDLSLLEYLENPFALAQWIVSGKKINLKFTLQTNQT